MPVSPDPTHIPKKIIHDTIVVPMNFLISGMHPDETGRYLYQIYLQNPLKAVLPKVQADKVWEITAEYVDEFLDSATVPTEPDLNYLPLRLPGVVETFSLTFQVEEILKDKEQNNAWVYSLAIINDDGVETIINELTSKTIKILAKEVDSF